MGIILTTVFATIVNYAADVYPESSGYARWPDDIFESPDFSLVGEFNFDAFSTLPFIAALAFAFSLFLADFFDTMGTLVGVGRQAGYVDEQGQMPEIRKPLLVDSLAAAAGGAVSASSATTYIESSSGVGGRRPDRLGQRRHRSALLPVHVHRAADRDGSAAGDRAGAPDRRLADDQRADRGRGGGRGRPQVGSEEATTAQLTRTTRPRRKLAGIDFHDLALGLSAAIVIMFMPFSFSITDGIAAGFIVYVFIRVFQGAWNTVHPLMWGAAIAFAIYFAIPIMQQEFDWI